MAGRRAHGEGSLFQRKDGRHKGKWVARINLPGGRRHEILCSTQAEARGKLREYIQGLSKGTEPLPQTLRLGPYLERWLEDRVRPRVAANTYERYRSACEVHILKDPIASMKLSEVRGRSVNDLLGRRAVVGAAPATLANIRAVLSAGLQQAVRDELIHENPVRKSDAPKQRHDSVKFLTKEQVKGLLETSKGSPIEVLIYTAVHTGARLSELLGLTWDRLDLERGKLTIDRQLQRYDKQFALEQLKTRGSTRKLDLSATLVQRLKAHEEKQVIGDRDEQKIPGLVFTSAEGRPLHRKTVLEWTNALLKKAKAPELGFHVLRHTCASLLINAGADPLRVQRQLGHSSVRVTLETYSHLFEERLKENADLLERELG